MTFIIVDRLPQTSKTLQAAKKIEAEIIQMSMQYWPRLLAQRIGERFGYQHELQTMPDSRMHGYLQAKLAPIPIQDFLIGVSAADLQPETESTDASEVLEEAD